jgi:hypothetical protein
MHFWIVALIAEYEPNFIAALTNNDDPCEYWELVKLFQAASSTAEKGGGKFLV